MSPGETNPILVAMLGARMHYAVPRAFALRRRLSAFFTDIAVPRLLARTTHAIGVAIGRRIAAGVDRRSVPRSIAPVVTFPSFGLDYWRRVQAARDRNELTSAY